MSLLGDPSAQPGLRFGALGEDAVHLCVDMQRLFQAETPWRTPWVDRVLPQMARLCDHRPERAVFTRFIPADHPREGPGAWSRYWTKWADLTRDRLDADLLDLVPELARFHPPASVVDKRTYSPWFRSSLADELDRRRARALIVTGGETDVCVLATVLGAVDRGYRTVVVADALCSSTDETHDAVLKLYAGRFDQQVETATCEEILDAWR